MRDETRMGICICICAQYLRVRGSSGRVYAGQSVVGRLWEKG